MTQIIVLQPEAFFALAQASEGHRYVHEQVADAGYPNLRLDAFGDWVAVCPTATYHAGAVVTLDTWLQQPLSTAVASKDKV